jgi:hypothetical protein
MMFLKGFDQKKDKGIVLSNSLCSHERRLWPRASSLIKKET